MLMILREFVNLGKILIINLMVELVDEIKSLRLRASTLMT
jgi:hypothetical protein